MYQNYHRHSSMSNIIISDSVVSNEDYAQRAVALGHSLLSSVEHGWCGRYIESYELAKKYKLKLVIGSEVYFVKDRFEKDRTNAHMVLLAKNENGRKAINRILSEANLTGFYYRARIDLELLLSLPKDDVWVTSACLSGVWKYDNYEELIIQIHNHFGQNFFLEVQNHNTVQQKEINEKIINISNHYGIKIIFGVDSHYIYENQAKDRDDFIRSKHISYEDETGWYLDYPSDEVAFNRFMFQGVLTKPQIEEAMKNTNTFLQVEEYTSDIFNKDMKLPTLYPDKTQKEKNDIFKNLISEKWEEEKQNIDKSMWNEYVKEIIKEVNVVVETGMADYFLLDYEIVKRSEELGGMLTRTGRGSIASFYTAKLLGFTTVDRISATVQLFPERFMTKERILDAKTLPDIDFNLGNPEVFAQAQIDIMGEGHSYPMLAYGTLRIKAAWKLYARAKDIDFEIANSVSDEIGKFELAKKYNDEEQNPEEFISPEYLDYFLESKKYLGIVAQAGIHPCGSLLFSKDIKEEIGLINLKGHICACMDGLWAEKYGFLKNDLLKVSVVELIYKTYEKLERKPHQLPELIEICDGDEKVWDIYKNAQTIGINQVEGDSTRGRVAKYSPSNIAELSAFIASVRPGFQSMYKIFENRESFSYNVPTLDSLIQSKDIPYSFMLYQEQAMNVLAYAGIPIADTFTLIKNIAKKRYEKVFAYKETFIEGMKSRLIDNENLEEDKAIDVANLTWQIIEDSSSYLFNSAHSYCVAGDSLYGAYLKAHHPIQFYETLLNLLEGDGSKDRLVRAIEEAEKSFKINFPRYKFGQDNRTIKGNVEKWEITTSLKSIKGFSSSVSDRLYELGQNKYETFLDFLLDAEEKGYISKKYEDLIQINYFDVFGSNLTLLKFFKEFTKGKARYSRKHSDKTKVKRIELLKEFWKTIPDEKFPVWQQLAIERDVLGYIHATYSHINKKFVFVMELNEKFAPRIQAYCLNNGKQTSLKIQKKTFENNNFLAGDILYVNHFKEKPSISFVNNNYVESETETTWWIDQYRIIKPEEFDEIVSRVK